MTDFSETRFAAPAPLNCGRPAFTLVELLVVIGIISLLLSILTPSLTAVKELGRSAKCLTNLHNLSVAAALYQTDNNGSFWPCSPVPPKVYFWGRLGNPVDITEGPIMAYCNSGLEDLWCPSLPWGSYMPQGAHVNEPTTTYGYNAWCLDPAFWGKLTSDKKPMPPKRISQLSGPGDLFVFADSAMFWAPGGVGILQNSTSLDPVTMGTWGANTTATTHFRHLGRTNALCADGHAANFDLEGGKMTDKEHKLGFVGARNIPHYDQE